jgi:hypothetical protein
VSTATSSSTRHAGDASMYTCMVGQSCCRVCWCCVCSGMCKQRGATTLLLLLLRSPPRSGILSAFCSWRGDGRCDDDDDEDDDDIDENDVVDDDDEGAEAL